MAYEIGKRIITGRKAVSTAGTAEPIVSSSVQCFMVMLSADLGNNGAIVVGNSEVVAASGSQKGVVLLPGNNPVTFIIDDASKIYADAQTNGEAICFVIFQT